MQGSNDKNEKQKCKQWTSQNDDNINISTRLLTNI